MLRPQNHEYIFAHFPYKKQESLSFEIHDQIKQALGKTQEHIARPQEHIAKPQEQQQKPT